MMDLGLLNNATRWTAAQLDRCSKKEIFAVVSKFYNKLFLFVLFSAFLGAFFYFIIYRKISTLESIYVLSSCLFLSLGIKNNAKIAFLQGVGYLGIVQFWAASINIVFLLLASLFAYMGFTSFVVFTVLSFAHVLNSFNLEYLLKKLDLILEPQKNVLLGLEAKNSLNNSSWKTGIGVMTSMSFFNLLPFILVEMYSNSEMVRMLFAIQIVRAISTFSQAPFYSRIPELSLLYSRQKIKRTDSIRKLFMFYSLTVFVSGVLFVYILNHLKITRGIFDLNSEILLLISLSFIVERYGNMLLQYLATFDKIIWHIINPIMLIVVLLIWRISGGVLGLMDGILLSYIFVVSFISLIVVRQMVKSSLYFDIIFLLIVLGLWILSKV